MKNNQGFTVVELLASFTLMMVVTMFLFEVVMELKNIYVSSSLETSVKNENALIARAINDVAENGINFADCPGETCPITIDQSSQTVIVNNQTFKVPNDTSISALEEGGSFINNQCNSGNGFISFNYKVVSSDFRDGIPFNLVLNC